MLALVKNLAERLATIRSRRHDALREASALLSIFARVGECAFDEGWGAGVREVFRNECVGSLSPELYGLGVRRRRNYEQRGKWDDQSIHGFHLSLSRYQRLGATCSSGCKRGLTPRTFSDENVCLTTAIFSRTHCLPGQQKAMIAGQIHRDVIDKKVDISP
jgi:hypothetical protein